MTQREDVDNTCRFLVTFYEDGLGGIAVDPELVGQRAYLYTLGLPLVDPKSPHSNISHYSITLRKTISRCLAYYPDQRLTCSEILDIVTRARAVMDRIRAQDVFPPQIDIDAPGEMNAGIFELIEGTIFKYSHIQLNQPAVVAYRQDGGFANNLAGREPLDLAGVQVDRNRGPNDPDRYEKWGSEYLLFIDIQ